MKTDGVTAQWLSPSTAEAIHLQMSFNCLHCMLFHILTGEMAETDKRQLI